MPFQYGADVPTDTYLKRCPVELEILVEPVSGEEKIQRYPGMVREFAFGFVGDVVFRTAPEIHFNRKV